MDNTTTISISQSLKDDLDEDRMSSWNEHLRDLLENRTTTVRLESDQIDEIARLSAKKTLERLEEIR